MDRLFFDLVLLLAGGSLEDACPAPAGSDSTFCGVTLNKRLVNTRIEVWLGGLSSPEPDWSDSVLQYFGSTFPERKIFPYRSFVQHKESAPTGRR